MPTSSDRGPRRSAALTAVVVLSATVLAGCGGKSPGDDAAAPRPTNSPTAKTPQTRGPTPSAPATPSAPPSTHSPPATPRPSSPVTADPARGPVLHGTGYRLRLPTTWHEVTKEVDTPGVDRAAGARAAVHGFTSNVNVVVSRKGFRLTNLAMVIEQIRLRLLPSAPDYEILPTARIDGTRAGHLAGLRKTSGTRYWLTQYVTTHAGRGYIISFSFSPKITAEKRKRLIASILNTWSWRG